MTKIVAAFDGLKFSESTLQYATNLAQQNNAHLVGVFLDDFTYTSYKIYDLIYEKGGLIGPAKKKLDKKDEKSRASSAKKFEDRCKEAGIKYTLHRDKSIAIQELLHESIYADLLIVDCTETFTHYNEKLPTDFIRHLLCNAQCPVLVVPHLYKPIEKITILYDGEPSSVHAIKMFSYLLPGSTGNPAEVISVKQDKQSFHLPDNRLMKEFMKRHFPEAVYTVLKGMAEPEIINYIKKQKENSLVVLGAYRRNMVSRWFRASMADALMQQLKAPLFIAHNK
jgi:hypothetical protein